MSWKVEITTLVRPRIHSCRVPDLSRVPISRQNEAGQPLAPQALSGLVQNCVGLSGNSACKPCRPLIPAAYSSGQRRWLEVTLTPWQASRINNGTLLGASSASSSRLQTA